MPAVPVASGAPVRPLRADARRNRERLLAVAEEVFAAKGTGASTEEIARQAGVGIGTVFRHFPTKEALLAAVFLGRFERLGEQARALSTAAEPGPAFFEFFTLVVDQAPAKNAFADAMEQAGVDVQGVTSGIAGELTAALEELLGRAQAVGAVRADLGVAELKALLVGASRAVEFAGDREACARTLAVFVDGMRPTGG
ncbi:TetR/AcrR family transcriptional regulator [Streptacidiphilus carbonis]|uniref:TetR/AcrR family transcriptional regulator n=1 Tax=Streptacidiphilus carbonis TaxID=105422 RepID=UPI001F2AA686|nr:TetR/AcrR family transcriptional regulator [Streptacidiphilus carbonis]